MLLVMRDFCAGRTGVACQCRVTGDRENKRLGMRNKILRSAWAK